MIEGKILTLGIESSCDETSISFVLEGRTILSNTISSQINIHKIYGGVVPEIASRHHLENINEVLSESLEEARKVYPSLTLKDIDAIGVTKGPGLVGALLIGITTAKTLAFTLNKPLIGVHHILGHIAANYIEHKDLTPPFISLVVSGGHTSIVDVKDYTSVEVLGETRDDAVGEAYDKVARVLSLPYPGGPEIDKIAKEGNRNAIHFKRVFLDKDSLDFSFSGIKTGVLNFLNSKKQQGESLEKNNITDEAGKPITKADIAASFQEAVLEVIVKKAIVATKKKGADKLILAGGVASNSRLRELLDTEAEKEGIKVYAPSKILCTDNGAMIATMAYFKFKNEDFDDLFMDAKANLFL